MEEKRSMVQQLFERLEVFAFAINRSEVVLDVSAKGCEVLGFSRDEIVGKNWISSFVPEEKREDVRRQFQDMLKGELRHFHNEYPVITRDRVERIFSWHNVLSSDESGYSIGMLISGDDVTDRRRAENASRNIENRLQVSLDSVIEGYQIVDSDWRYIYLNDSAAKQGRRKKGELLGKTMMDAYPGIERTPMFSHLRSCMTNRISHSMENEFTFPDGSKGWFELRIEPVPEGILILSMDITKSKEIAIELNQYRQRLEEVVSTRTAECLEAKEKLMKEVNAHKIMADGLKLKSLILDSVSDPIFLVNANGDLIYANETALDTYGYSVDELLRLNLRDLVRPEEAPKIENQLKSAIEKGNLELKMLHLRKDKSTIYVSVKHSPIETEHGQFIVSVVRDVSAES